MSHTTHDNPFIRAVTGVERSKLKEEDLDFPVHVTLRQLYEMTDHTHFIGRQSKTTDC